MIPNFETPSGNLPVGMHWATWDEITIRYGINPTRRKQLKGLKAAADELKRCGCTTLLLNGRFVTNKRLPGDFDALWVFDNVNLAILNPTLKDVKPPRMAQKVKYLGELLPISDFQSQNNLSMVKYFQIDRSNNPKGIIALDLRGLP